MIVNQILAGIIEDFNGTLMISTNKRIVFKFVEIKKPDI